jgi:phage shock protein PspC (stress-responsive transcriptional regulator)
MLAYDFPLLSVFWSMLMFFGILLMVFFIIWCFIDNFRRRDHHGGAKLGWTVLILFIPVLGALIYIIARPPDATLAT